MGFKRKVCKQSGRLRIVFDGKKIKCVDPCGNEQPLSACMLIALENGNPKVRFSKGKCDFDPEAKSGFIDKVAGRPTVWAYEDDAPEKKE
ncbi:MAG: hypothetical protein PHC68_17480 [Syntrophorhabdaceae bacterium]|nr:hypothetical protein [Syntrophorhabdaceae bacterium]